MTYEYAPEKFDCVSIVFRHAGTVLPEVVKRVRFWFLLIVHLVFVVLLRFDICGINRFVSKQADLRSAQIQVVSGMSVWFLVFYTSQCYTRYMVNHRAINNVFRTSHRFFLEVCSHMKPNGNKTVDLVARWMRLHMVLFFVEIRGKEMEPKDWVVLAQTGMVVPMERRFLERLIPPQRSLVLLYWMARATISGYAAMNCVGKGPPVLWGFIARLCDFDDAQKNVQELIEMPVPFPYFHLTQFMVIVSLALWAYGMATALCPFSTVMFTFLLLSTVCITELVNGFTESFTGAGATHFPLHIWFRIFCQNQDFLLRCSGPGGRYGIRSLLDKADGLWPCDRNANDASSIIPPKMDLGCCGSRQSTSSVSDAKAPRPLQEEPRAEMPQSAVSPVVWEPAAQLRALTIIDGPLSPLESGEVLLRYGTYLKEFKVTEGRITAREIDKQYALSTVMPRCRIRLSALGPDEKQSLDAAGVPLAYVHEEPRGTFHGLLAGHEYFVYVDEGDDAAAAAASAALDQRVPLLPRTAEIEPIKPLGSGEVTLRYGVYRHKFRVEEGRLCASEIERVYRLSEVLPGCHVKLSPQPPEERHALDAAAVAFTYLPEGPEGVFHGLLVGREYYVYVDESNPPV